MKRTAFLQAVLLVILLSASWLILLKNRSGENSDRPTEPPPATVPGLASDSGDPSPPEDETEASPAAPEALPPTPPAVAELEQLPAFWKDRIDALLNARSPNATRQALDRMREELFALPVPDAVGHLLAFLESGVDVPTGLAFQVREGGLLRGAYAFRAMVLDWLGQLDPATAARLAREELVGMGTRLSPDAYAVHMRNFAWGSPQDATATRAFLSDQVERMLEHTPWMQSSRSALAEAMDVAVYAQATESLPLLTNLLEGAASPTLQRASALAIERLVDQTPAEAAPLLLQWAQSTTPYPLARAGYLARLDPSAPESHAILTDYLTAPGVSTEETTAFLESFPNFNQSFSHNLLSINNPMTPEPELRQRLQAALGLMDTWQEDPRLEHLQPGIQENKASIRRLLHPSLKTGPPD